MHSGLLRRQGGMVKQARVCDGGGGHKKFEVTFFGQVLDKRYGLSVPVPIFPYIQWE